MSLLRSLQLRSSDRFGSGCVTMANEPSSEGGLVYIRVSIPDKNLQKCLQLDLDGTVGQAKEVILGLIGGDLHDSWNYGLFCPPTNGRAGKFLQEERPLKEYPLCGPIGFLEFKYKRRVYRSLAVNPSKLKKIQSKANQKQFMDSVKVRDIAKVTKWLNKGLDPNFHNKDTGETPLCLAVRVEKARELIMALVSGGAHLDFRARDTMAPLHKAAVHNNYDAIRTLLDLGQSPNCRDSKGLTALYYACYYETRALCAERLLFDHAVLGVTNELGLAEIHQACRHGRVQHLEYLLSYGADLNARTNNGNTPLHICALAKQEACARLLLFRGADRRAMNNGSQTAYQTALVNGHKVVAELIKSYQDDDVVPLKGCAVKLNSQRRTSTTTLRNPRSSSMNRLTDYGDSGISEPSSPATSSTRHASGGMAGRRVRKRGDLGVAGSSSRSVCNLTAKHYSDDESALEGGVVFNWDSEYAASDLCSSLASSMRSHFREGSEFGSLRLTEARMRPSILPFMCPETSTLPRTVVLQKGAKGFGFVLRGAKVANAVDFQPTPEVPALQYFERVEPGTPADKASIRAGDYLLEINGENVVSASHEHTVKLIRDAGNSVALKVVTVDKHLPDQHRILAESFAQILSDYDSDRVSLRSGATSSVGGMDKTASIRSRASRTITETELEEIFARGGRPELPGEEGTASNPAGGSASGDGPSAASRPEIPQAPRLYADEADIKARLKANLSSNRSLSMVSGPTADAGGPSVVNAGPGPGEHSSNASSADDSGVSVTSVSAGDQSSSSSTTGGTLSRSRQPPPPPLRRASCGLSLATGITTSSTSNSSSSSTSSASASTAKSVQRDRRPSQPSPSSASSSFLPPTTAAATTTAVTFADDRIYEKAAEFLEHNTNATVLASSPAVLARLAAAGSRERIDVVAAESPMDSPASGSGSDSSAGVRKGSTSSSVTPITPETPLGSLPSSPPPPPPPMPNSPPDESGHDEDIPLPPPPPPLQSTLPNVPPGRRMGANGTNGNSNQSTESGGARRALIDMHEAKLRAAIAQRRQRLDFSPVSPTAPSPSLTSSSHQRVQSSVGAFPATQAVTQRRGSMPEKRCGLPLPPPPPPKSDKPTVRRASQDGAAALNNNNNNNNNKSSNGSKASSPSTPNAGKLSPSPQGCSSSSSSTATPSDDLLDSIYLPPPAGFADSPPKEDASSEETNDERTVSALKKIYMV